MCDRPKRAGPGRVLASAFKHIHFGPFDTDPDLVRIAQALFAQDAVELVNGTVDRATFGHPRVRFLGELRRTWQIG